jgi:hypothetical protein
MCITVFAEDFNSGHPEGSISVSSHTVGRDCLKETWPTCSGFELVIGREEVRGAAGALVRPYLIIDEKLISL